MKKILLLTLTVFILQGCSLLRIASQPFKNSVSKVPQATEKTASKIKCKGEIFLNENGTVNKCTKKYTSNKKTFNQKERKLNLREKISQFILNAQGYLLWFVIIAVVLSLSGCGWVIGALFSGVRGVGRVAKDLVKGISKGKKYIRQNGNKYTESERKAYQDALDHMMNKIDSSLSGKNAKKIVNKLRVEE